MHRPPNTHTHSGLALRHYTSLDVKQYSNQTHTTLTHCHNHTNLCTCTFHDRIHVYIHVYIHVHPPTPTHTNVIAYDKHAHLPHPAPGTPPPQVSLKNTVLALAPTLDHHLGRQKTKAARTGPISGVGGGSGNCGEGKAEAGLNSNEWRVLVGKVGRCVGGLACVCGLPLYVCVCAVLVHKDM